MEKLMAIMLALTMVFSLCACNSTALPAATPTAAPVVGLVNDAEYNITADRMTELTGISLPLPAEATDITYNVLTPSTTPIAVAEFTLNGQQWYLRAKAVGFTELTDDNREEWNISGLYYTFTEEDAAVSYCAARADSCGEAGFIAWVDAVPGILYNLCTVNGVDTAGLTAAAEAVFVPAQGDVG